MAVNISRLWYIYAVTPMMLEMLSLLLMTMT